MAAMSASASHRQCSDSPADSGDHRTVADHAE